MIRSKRSPLTLATLLQNGDSSASRGFVPSGESLCTVSLDGAPDSSAFSSVSSSGATLALGFASKPQYMFKAFQKQFSVPVFPPGTEGKGQEAQAHTLRKGSHSAVSPAGRPMAPAKGPTTTLRDGESGTRLKGAEGGCLGHACLLWAEPSAGPRAPGLGGGGSGASAVTEPADPGLLHTPTPLSRPHSRTQLCRPSASGCPCALSSTLPGGGGHR